MTPTRPMTKARRYRLTWQEPADRWRPHRTSIVREKGRRTEARRPRSFDSFDSFESFDSFDSFDSFESFESFESFDSFDSFPL